MGINVDHQAPSNTKHASLVGFLPFTVITK